MRVRIDGIQISSISTCLPSKVVHCNQFSELYGEQEVQRTIKNTGIKQFRAVENGVCTSDLCAKAAEVIFEKGNINPASIDGIVFVSETPDYIMPATSVVLQHRLGLQNTTVAFDINYGCSGYVYGLYQAALLIGSGGCSRVLLLVGDTSTRIVHPQDKSASMIFGDAGSATLVEKGDENIYFNLKTDGSGFKHLIIPAGSFRHPQDAETVIEQQDENGNLRTQHHLYMNGMEITNFAMREVPPMINELLAQCNWSKEDVGIFALHQANQFIVEYLAKKMKLPRTSVPISLAYTGNTSSASIPLLFSLEGNKLKNDGRLNKTILCGFGVGLSWAAAATSLVSTQFFEPVDL